MTTRRTVLKGLAAATVSASFTRPVLAASCSPRKLWTMMGDYPHTHALMAGAVKSPCVALDIAPVKVPSTAFARAVAMEFDISELALVTFLMAKAYGRKLVLLPAVNLSRYQHRYLVYNSERGLLEPKDLERARIGTRLFTATTPTWVRGILASDYGVDVGRIRWVTYQKPNVPEFRDPPNVTMVPPGTDITAMLLRGEIDAAVLDPIPSDPRLKPVIHSPGKAENDWAAKHHAIQINHMVVVKEDLTRCDQLNARTRTNRHAWVSRCRERRWFPRLLPMWSLAQVGPQRDRRRFGAWRSADRVRPRHKRKEQTFPPARTVCASHPP